MTYLPPEGGPSSWSPTRRGPGGAGDPGVRPAGLEATALLEVPPAPTSGRSAHRPGSTSAGCPGRGRPQAGQSGAGDAHRLRPADAALRVGLR
ncbi:hypothetical protein NKH77_03345 [Streptomyces sp. M19]